MEALEKCPKCGKIGVDNHLFKQKTALECKFCRSTSLPCPDCEGTGIGDYPWECHTCHGTGIKK